MPRYGNLGRMTRVGLVELVVGTVLPTAMRRKEVPVAAGHPPCPSIILVLFRNTESCCVNNKCIANSISKFQNFLLREKGRP